MNASAEELVRGRLLVAQQRLARAYPFHVRFLAQWRVQAARAISTFGVTVKEGKILLYFNPEFAAECSLPQLGGVLLHETHHLLLGHVFLDVEQFADSESLLIAMELSANEYIDPAILPGEPILLSRYPQLPPREDTMTRYRRLACRRKNEKGIGMYQESGGNVPISAVGDGEDSQSAQESGPLHPLDDHDVWREAHDLGVLGELAVRAAVMEAAQNLTHEEWQQVSSEIRKEITKIAGDHAGDAVEYLNDCGNGHLPWNRLLRRYIKQATELQPTFQRPPRRFPELVGIVPGRRRDACRAHVMVVIDTSGSMSAAWLEMIAGEVTHMARTHSVTLVECDCAVRFVRPFRGTIETLHGRGGTDFRPPFENTLLKKVKPDVIVYASDGIGPAPESAPSVPVIWCITPDGVCPAKWGRVVRLPSAEEDQ